MTSYSRIIASCTLVAALTSVSLRPSGAGANSDAAQHQALGVALAALPAGWVIAPSGKFPTGDLTFVTMHNGDMDLRLSIQPLGLQDTSDEQAAATAAADALVQDYKVTTPVTRTTMTIDGSPAVVLHGTPGPVPGLEIVVAHNGAAYDVVTFGSDTLQADQQEALASVRFIPRTGSFPPKFPPIPFVPSHETRSLPSQPIATSVSPSAVPNGIYMYIFWGQTVNHGTCNPSNELGGGDLITGGPPPAGCGGNFYGQGDHTGQDTDAIDWNEASGNNVFAQSNGISYVTHAGPVQGKFSGYGNWVVLNNGQGFYSYYAHLQDVSVTVGQQVSYGNVIGHSGCSGTCSGPHVHVAWVQNPTLDSFGQPYNGTPEPQSPLYSFNGSGYNPLTSNEIIHGY